MHCYSFYKAFCKHFYEVFSRLAHCLQAPLAIIFIATCIVCAVPMPLAHAQTAYPTKPVKLLVGFPAGGGTDVFARVLAQGLSSQLGQSFVVDNKPGAGGVLAGQSLTQTTGDGYTLLMGSTSTQAIAPFLYAKRPYGPQDFTPIAHIASVGVVLLAHPAAPFNTVTELVAYAKAHPGQLNYASGGNGVTNHLAMELFKIRTGTFITHIPYRGSAPALQDVIGGQVSLMFDSIASSGPQIRSGKVKAIGIAGLSPSDALPGVATLSEAGAKLGLTGFDTPGWVALYGPKGLPPAITARLQEAIATVLASPDVAQRFAAAGALPRYMDAPTLTAYEAGESRKWGQAIAFSGAKID